MKRKRNSERRPANEISLSKGKRERVLSPEKTNESPIRSILNNTKYRVGAVIASAILAAAGMQLSKEDNQQEMGQVAGVTQPSTADAKEIDTSLAEMDGFIETIEKKMMLLMEKIDQKCADEALRNRLAGPLETIRANRNNHKKNTAKFLQETQERKRELQSLDGSSDHVFYYFTLQLRDAAAAFDSTTRMVSLNPYFDTNDLLDFFVLYHELVHAKDDQIRREKMQKGEMKDYGKTLELMNDKSNILFLPDEINAHATTLEAMNVYFDGALERLGEKATQSEIQRLFQGKTKSRRAPGLFAMIADMTKAYYGSPKNGKKHPDDFVKLIHDIHKRGEPRTFYEVTPTGDSKLSTIIP